MIPAVATGEQACHELLLRLAGRLPDELLWRLRDWLAAGAGAVLAASLPRELLRHRVGVTDDERDLLVAAVGRWGASRHLLDAVLPVPVPDEPPVTFLPGTGGIDPAALSVLAVVRGHDGCVELRQGGRVRNAEPNPGARQPDQRIIVVLGGEQPWILTGTLQRVLRAHGDRTPCVEVLPPHGEPSAYHRAAIIGTASVWRSAAALVRA